MLTLPIKRKWFDMILAGEKTEEYRENTAYWRKRLIIRENGEAKAPRTLILRNGYRADSPKALIEISGVTMGNGRPEWGAEPGKAYLRLHIVKAVKWE